MGIGHGKMMLIVILPSGYAIRDFDNSDPAPTLFKIFKNRLAFFWELGPNEHTVTWKMGQAAADELPALVEMLNRAAHERERKTETVQLVNQVTEAPEATDANVDAAIYCSPETNAEGAPKEDEDAGQLAPMPHDPASWLIEAARRLPIMGYAVGVVGVAAAAAISLGFFLGSPLYAIYGAVAVLVGMVVLRVFASAKPIAEPISLRWEVKVLIWASLLAIIAALTLGVVRLGRDVLAPASPPSGSMIKSKTDDMNGETTTPGATTSRVPGLVDSHAHDSPARTPTIDVPAKTPDDYVKDDASDPDRPIPPPNRTSEVRPATNENEMPTPEPTQRTKSAHLGIPTTSPSVIDGVLQKKVEALLDIKDAAGVVNCIHGECAVKGLRVSIRKLKQEGNILTASVSIVGLGAFKGGTTEGDLDASASAPWDYGTSIRATGGIRFNVPPNSLTFKDCTIDDIELSDNETLNTEFLETVHAVVAMRIKMRSEKH